MIHLAAIQDMLAPVQSCLLLKARLKQKKKATWKPDWHYAFPQKEEYGTD